MTALLLILLLLLGSPVYGAITEQGSGSQRAGIADTSGTLDSLDLAFPGNVTSGCLLIVGGATWATTAPTSIGVTDMRSTSYAVLSDSSNANVRKFIAYGIVPTGGANTVTVNPQGTQAYISYGIDEFCGADATPLDVDGGTNSGIADNAPFDDITTATANALIIGVMHHGGSSDTIDPGVNYTQIAENQNNTTAQDFSLVFRSATTVTTYTVDWLISGDQDWWVRTASFEEQTAAVKRPAQVVIVH